MIALAIAERRLQTATELAALVAVLTMAGRQLQLNMGEQMKSSRFVVLGLAAFLIGMSLGACKSATAPAPHGLTGSWNGTALPLVKDSVPLVLDLTLTESPDGKVSGSGTWGKTALTVVSGTQEDVTYAGAAGRYISLRVSSPTGIADLNGQILGDRLTLSVDWFSGPLYTVTLTPGLQ